LVLTDEERKAKKREYSQRPEVKARAKARQQKPENKLKVRTKQASPENREREKEYRSRPEVKARQSKYHTSTEYKTRRKELRRRPENIARKKELDARPENIARKKETARKSRSRPEAKARAKAYQSRPEYKTKSKKLRDVQRMKVLQYYSKKLSKSNIPCCNCCGLNRHIHFLALDHIAGKKQMDSEPELIKLGYSSKMQQQVLIRWILENNFPKGFQILCHNCNNAKGFYGKCPMENKPH